MSGNFSAAAADNQPTGFTQVPNAILKNNHLSLGARMLYSILLSYCWHKEYCFPSYETLMQDMDCGSQALSLYIKELIHHGLIAVVRRGQGKTNLYQLTNVVQPAPAPRHTQPEPQERPTEAEPSSSLNFKEQEVWKSKTEEYSCNKYSDGYLSSARKAESGGEDYVNSHSTADKPRDRTPVTHQTGGEQYTNHSRTNSRNIETIEPQKNTPPLREKRLDMYDDIQRGVLLEYTSDFAREFHDQAPLSSSTTRMYHLFRQSGVSMETFIDYLYSARLTTKERTANICFCYSNY